MYFLVDEKDCNAVRGMYHERTPDGRLVLTPQELKMLGSVESVQVVGTSRELKELMSKSPSPSPAIPEDGGQTGDGQVDGAGTDIADEAVDGSCAGHGADAPKDTEAGTLDGETWETETTDKDNSTVEEATDGTADTGGA